MTDRLQEFGHNFQIKSVVCLMTKPNFIEQIIDILDESHYDNDSLKWIVKESKEYFTKYWGNPEHIGKILNILRKS